VINLLLLKDSEVTAVIPGALESFMPTVMFGTEHILNLRRPPEEASPERTCLFLLRSLAVNGHLFIAAVVLVRNEGCGRIVQVEPV